MYRFFVSNLFPGRPEFPADSVWRKLIPSKINAFMWIVAHKKILTLDILQRRGLAIANICVMCCKEEESADHLLVDCEFTSGVWNELKKARSLTLTPNRDIITTIRSWNADCPTDLNGWIVYCALHSICWQVWLERNQRTFNDCCLPPTAVYKKAMHAAVEWLVAFGKISRDQAKWWLRTYLNV
ncbi:unnamed protein product [Linum trigynum]|uniref:Reverse transcriptase zinc-binding domain-containing protein n=1 Tax=Linum trigynum TaxID=586398 RepID=A0AAV2GJ23_9ROSI